MPLPLPVSLAPPLNCPYCTTPLTRESDFPYCPNYHCPERIRGRIQKFVDVLDAKNVGEETIRGLVILGYVKTPADLFDLTEDQFIKVDRKGVKHYRKFIQGLSLVREMTPAMIFASLDIEGIGTWQNICAVPGLQTVSQILDAVDQNRGDLFSQAIRVSSEKAADIIKQIRDRRVDIESLLSKVRVKQVGTKLLGKVFCITGSLTSGPRSFIERRIQEAGGQSVSGVSPRTSYLVTNDPASGSSKNKKAQQLGIPIISEQQLLEMIGA